LRKKYLHETPIKPKMLSERETSKERERDLIYL
jgi:hypothetical protein